MDFVSLALNYLISMVIGTPLENLFSQFYTTHEFFQTSKVHNHNSFYYYLDIYDFIIVGAGSAGCVVANRLSAQNYRVLLLEAGGLPFPLTIVPSMVHNMVGNPNVDWGYKSVPQKNSFQAFINNSYTINRGKGLGGSGMLNFNMYMRGRPYDFEEWANVTGDESWKYENLIPFFKKIEDYHGYFRDDKLHGHDGPLYIESSKHFPLRDEWFAAGSELGLKLQDPSGFQNEGVFPIDTTTWRGTSFSTYRTYLQPVLDRPNLKVITYAHAQKVILNDKNKAVAVVYKHKGKLHQAVASREIIVSAGAISSPQLLMLSGIGPKEHLQSVGIPLKVDLPVGKNLHDHYLVILGPFIVQEGKSVKNDRDYDSLALSKYLYFGEGPYSTAGFETGALLTSSMATNPNRSDIYLTYHPIGVDAKFGSDFENRYGLKPGILQKYLAADVGNDSFFVDVVLAKPKSSGEVRLANADPNKHPIIEPNFLNHPDDIKILVEGIHKALKLVNTTKAFGNIGTKFTAAKFPGCENHLNLSEEYWECYVRHFCLSFWDVSGTCKMGEGSANPNAVLDSQLRVLGTSGLRVIDASVMPEITTTNTNSPTIMIAEKGSQLILDYWKNYIY